MTGNKKFFSPFHITAVLIILASAMICMDVFVFQSYPIFTDEGQIQEAIDSTFGVFAPYL